MAQNEVSQLQDQTKRNVTKIIRTGIRDIGITEADMRKVCEAAINSARG